MPNRNNSDISASEQQRILRLIKERHLLEARAKELKYEIAHMKRALRVTSNQVRKMNHTIELIRRGKPSLTLVISNDPPQIVETDAPFV